jgi:hypothetical protein
MTAVGGERETPTAHAVRSADNGREAEVARLLAVIQRAKRGDERALPELRRLYDAVPDLWKDTGNLAKAALANWVDTAYGHDLATAEATRRVVRQMRFSLASEDAPPLERLLADRIAVAWLQVNYVDTVLAQRLTGEGLRPEQVDFYQSWLDRAQKRYLAAIKALAQVRRLLGPVAQASPLVQVNVGEKQVNVACVATAGAATPHEVVAEEEQDDA